MSTPKHPKLRKDLHVSQIDGATYELVDPTTGARLRLDSIGYILAEQFEAGEIGVDEAVEHLRVDHAVKVMPSKVIEFLKKADNLGFLEVSLVELGFGDVLGDAKEAEFAIEARLSVEEEVKRFQEDLGRPFYALRHMQRRTIVLILASALLFVSPWKLRANGPLVVRPFKHHVVRSPSSNKVDEVFVREGEMVREGQPVAKLHGYGTEIARKKLEIAKTQAELERLQKGATSLEISQIEKKVEISRKLAHQMEERAKQSLDLNEKGLISAEELQKVLSEREIRSKSVEEAEVELKIIRRGTRPEIIRAKKAEKEELFLDLNLLLQMDGSTTVRSPIHGIVASPDTFQLVGRQLQVGDPIMEISDPSKMTVELHSRESDIAWVKSGNPVAFKVQAIPDFTFRANISRISPVVEELVEKSSYMGARSVRLYSDIDNPGGRLMPGMTGTGRVDCGWTMLGLLFFRPAIRYFRVEYVI